MSGKIKRSSKKSNSADFSKQLGDVTLADFANCAVPLGKGRRLKKATSTLTSVVRKVKEMSVTNDNRAWDEKLEEFDADLEFVEQDDEDREKEVVLRRSSRRRRKTTRCSSEADQTGYDYPLDIWYMLSDYIRPQDVAIFAAICKSSHQVTNTAKFWFSLYKRYYKTVACLPERLKPDCMVRHYGLKACVVRALYFTYPPFVTKAKLAAGLEADPHQLIKRQCVLMWHERYRSDYWQFCFKLKHATAGRGEACMGEGNSDFLGRLDNILANCEAGCKVLQVTSLNFVPHPLVLGLTLTSVSLTLTSAMRTKLQLDFNSGPLNAHKLVAGAAGSTSVILNRVLKVRVLDWWHPLYPHSTDKPILSRDQHNY